MIDFDFDKLTRNPWLAGLGGGIVALRFTPGLTWYERWLNVISGGICAGFGGPALTEWLHIATPGIQAFASFVIGMFGLSLAAAVWQAVRDMPLSEMIRDAIKRRLG